MIFHQNCWNIGKRQKAKPGHRLYMFYKICHYFLKHKTIKKLEYNIGKNLYDFGYDDDLVAETSKV